MQKENEVKRLNIDMPLILFQQMKVQTIWQNKTIRKYVIQAIIEKINRDKDLQKKEFV